MPDTLSAEEAAARLGVKKSTLYTYVSRGWIRAVAGTGRSRRYPAAEIESLRTRAAAAGGHAAAASSALDWGAPILESAITSIDVDGPNYRGIPALSLAERDTPFEAVAELLWNGALPAVPSPFDAPDLGLDPAGLAALLPDAGAPSRVLPVVVAALGARDPLRAASIALEQRCARTLVRRMTAWLALGTGPREGWLARAEGALSAPSIAAALTVALGGPPGAVRWVDRALVCLADHELNASTFAARVAAGTGADPYAVVAAALATWSGPRHGTASEEVERLLRASDGPGGLGRAVAERLRRGDGIPGFGQRLYPDGDPRAERLLLDAATADPDPARQAALREILARVAEAGYPPPNVDFGLVALSLALGLPAGAPSALFAIGRTAGWLAHAWEQRATGKLLRPRAHYVGR